MNKFTVHYPNGIKRHISKKELDLLGASLKPIGPHEYRAASLHHDLEQTTGPDYLPGAFVIEHAGQREHERLQTAKALISQLKLRGWVPEVSQA